jgi:TrmH family RNA methyltransferase
MLSKAIVKYIQSLRHKKFREQHHAFIAEGPKVVKDLLVSGEFLCKMICAVDEWFNENEELLSTTRQENKIKITEFELQKISLLHTPNKVVAVFNKKEEKALNVKKIISLMLDDIQDPGNMGTIIRIADWFGIKNIICGINCADAYNPKVVQSSMGSLGRVNFIYTDLKNFIDNNKDVSVFAATLTGKSISTLNKLTEGLILIGNESKGISEELLLLANGQITIPKFGDAESLNAAVATGIILSHIVDPLKR